MGGVRRTASSAACPSCDLLRSGGSSAGRSLRSSCVATRTLRLAALEELTSGQEPPRTPHVTDRGQHGRYRRHRDRRHAFWHYRCRCRARDVPCRPAPEHRAQGHGHVRLRSGVGEGELAEPARCCCCHVERWTTTFSTLSPCNDRAGCRTLSPPRSSSLQHSLRSRRSTVLTPVRAQHSRRDD